MAQFKKVLACNNSAEAGMVISLLKQRGYHPLELDTSSHIGFAGADLYYYVQVPEQEYDQVKKLLIECNMKSVI